MCRLHKAQESHRPDLPPVLQCLCRMYDTPVANMCQGNTAALAGRRELSLGPGRSIGSVEVANGCFEQAGVKEYVAEFARIRDSAGSLATSATDLDGALGQEHRSGLHSRSMRCRTGLGRSEAVSSPFDVIVRHRNLRDSVVSVQDDDTALTGFNHSIRVRTRRNDARQRHRAAGPNGT